MFIVLEGLDGAGKSTIMGLLQEWMPQRYPDADVIYTQEPGGTTIGQQIKQILNDPELDVDAAAMLLVADRLQHAREVLWPAISAGKIIFADRYVPSFYAYQVWGQGLFEFDGVIDRLHAGVALPDLVIYLDIQPSTSAARCGNKLAAIPDSERFLTRVRRGYSEHKLFYPVDWIDIDAEQPLEAVWAEVRQAVERLLG
jgi:dTMP kinase